jgi:hypothetical protein
MLLLCVAHVQGILVGWISSSLWSILYIKAIRTPEAYRLITGRPIPKREGDADSIFNVKIVAQDTGTSSPSADTAVEPAPATEESQSLDLPPPTSKRNADV